MLVLSLALAASTLRDDPFIPTECGVCIKMAATCSHVPSKVSLGPGLPDYQCAPAGPDLDLLGSSWGSHCSHERLPGGSRLWTWMLSAAGSRKAHLRGLKSKERCYSHRLRSPEAGQRFRGSAKSARVQASSSPTLLSLSPLLAGHHGCKMITKHPTGRLDMPP